MCTCRCNGGGGESVGKTLVTHHGKSTYFVSEPTDHDGPDAGHPVKLNVNLCIHSWFTALCVITAEELCIALL